MSMPLLRILNPNPNPLFSPPSFLRQRNPNPNPPFLTPRSYTSANQSEPNPKPKKRPPRRETPSKNPCPKESSDPFPSTIPRKPRRGRRSESVAVEDFIRDSLESAFTSIRQQNADILEGKQTADILKEKSESAGESNNDGKERDEEEEEEDSAEAVVEEEDPDWPLDADIGWGVRASEYFEKHPIRNVVAEDGAEIDWEGEMEEGLVKEINCLEWESFAFHPSPLIVLVFERYNRAADNWKLLKELEKAALMYWNAKDRLPPRTVKIDINIETDLAYALKVKECPQLLFLKGNKILYRERELRTADELVLMIAHFYYNARKPSWVDASLVARPF